MLNLCQLFDKEYKLDSLMVPKRKECFLSTQAYQKDTKKGVSK